LTIERNSARAMWLEQEAAAKIPLRDDQAGQPMQTEVAATGGGQAVLRGREARGIGDHDVPALTAADRLFEKAEHVLGVQSRPIQIQAIAYEVPACGRDGRTGAIHRVGARGAGTGGVDREAAGVAEEVEQGLARRQLCDGQPVVALVEEQTALLAPAHVRKEAHAVLQDLDLLGLLAACFPIDDLAHRPADAALA
jgi:hypothetical protein